MTGVRSVRTIVLVGLGASLFLKMILLEPLVLPLGGLELVLAAALLPFALLLRTAGIVLIAVACGTAHLTHGDAAGEALLATLSVGAATGAAYLWVAKDGRTWRWLAAGWTMSLVLSLGLATGSALLLGHEFPFEFVGIFGRVWLGINAVGIPLTLLALRAGGAYLQRPVPSARRT